jgi:membrane-associated protein
MEYLHTILDLILHLDKHLDALIQNYGAWSYIILFLIIFCETGLVVTPFLPGDSLLFAAGAIASRGSLNVHALALALFLAAVLGDMVNYSIGRYLGDRAFNSRFINRQYLERTHQFYEKYGGKTIIIARFVPIIRTFAPFLAGIGKMSYAKFSFYNWIGGAIWIGIILYAGFFFSEIPIVKNNFGLVVVAIIVISVIPVVIEVIRARLAAKQVG